MKPLIIYYSLTGNTRKIAQAIYNGICNKSGTCDIARMQDVDVSRLNDYDLIGLGSPVWGGVPPNVKQFIDTFPSLPGKYAFAFSTHAVLGQGFYKIIEFLQKKNLTVIGIRDWYGCANRPYHPYPYMTDGHPDEIDLKEASDFGKEMVDISLKISKEGPQYIPTLPPVPEIPPANTIHRPLPVFDREKCRYPGCTLCMDNCAVKGIDLKSSPQVFAKPCLSCYFCEMVCPTGAIYVDYEPLFKPHLERVMNVFIPYLEQAEAEGHFRRLIPRDKVGWNTPYYKYFDKHPRFVIRPD
jgi:flavodoxin/NAD-dependent dihydropyrimidine dehydrogenase PreA subunit